VADWKKLLDDAVKHVGDGVQAAGDGLRELADDARKVAGIGRGSLEIVPDRARHRLGGTIAGTVKLALTEPIAARRLVVAVKARRKPNALGRIAGRARESTPGEETVFDFESTIAGERIYEGGEHRFAIDLPDALDPSIDAGGLLGDALRAARTVHSLTQGQLRWTLVAFLDIPWKRNLSNSIEIAVRDDASDLDDDEPEPAPPPAPEPASARRDAAPPRREAAPASGSPEPERREPAIAATSASDFLDALDRCLASLQRRGFTVIHEHHPPPVDPAVVMRVLALHPDLEAELLQFYAVMDGLEIVVAQPRVVATRYDTVDAAQAVAARSGGAIGCLDELPTHGEIGPALFREFCDDTVRVLEIPTLHRLFDDSEDFPHRDGRNVVFGAIVLRHGDAGARRARLHERESTHPSRWWVVRGEDHGAALRDPKLLRWSELLTVCLEHLEHGRLPAGS
jgi:hypothetical protein